MKGDFTRDTFDPKKHFSRVLEQQGRVTLDADSNEQGAILLHYLRTLARDIIGPYGGPINGGGFFLKPDKEKGFIITPGRYYVDGILIESETEYEYAVQPDYPLPADDKLLAEIKKHSGQAFWLYLDVWERHITFIEDDLIREKALRGPDTCTRAKVVWQVKALPIDLPASGKFSKDDCGKPLDRVIGKVERRLAARVDPGHAIDDACVTPPDSKYRGTENHLYRVEIHRGGNGTEATFKWSRDNGSVVSSWQGTTGNDIDVTNSRGFSAGNWVELSHDGLELLGEPGALVHLVKVEGGKLSVEPGTTLPEWSDKLVHPKVRRWDQVETEDKDTVLTNGAMPVKETPAGATGKDIVWIDLEDGVQVMFRGPGEYHTGDYWLIPARVATGGIEWPNNEGAAEPAPSELLPRGIQHHYAPLGFFRWVTENPEFQECRCNFSLVNDCFTATRTPVAGTPSIEGRLIADVPKKTAARGKTRRKKTPAATPPATPPAAPAEGEGGGT